VVHKKILKTITPLLLLALTLFVGSLSGCDFFLPEEEPPDEGKVKFEIEKLAINPSGIMVGESAAVTATVSNSGDAAGTYTAVLLKEGSEIARQDVSIEADSHKEVTFAVRGDIAGSYRLSIEKYSAVLAVYDWNPYTIQYDSGVSLGQHYAVGGLGQIVHFTSQAKPFKIDKILVYGEAVLDNLKELDSRHITLRIWSEDRSTLLWSQDFPWRVFEGSLGWKEIKVPSVEVTGDFHVELGTNSELSYTVGGQSTVRNNIAIG
jgi:hypothetical protein